MKKSWKCLAALLLACAVAVNMPGTMGVVHALALTTPPAVGDEQAGDGPDIDQNGSGGNETGDETGNGGSESTTDPTDPETGDGTGTGETGNGSGNSGTAPGGGDADGSVTVFHGTPEQEQDFNENADVVVDLYQVALGAMDADRLINFTLNAPFADLEDDLKGVIKNGGEEAGAELLAAMARKAAYLAVSKDDATGLPKFDIEPFRAGQSVGDDQEISNLPFGLYMVVVRDNSQDYSKYPYLYLEDDEVVTRVRTEEYIYTFWPQLVFIPANDGSGWDTDVEMVLKPEQSAERVGSLQVVKTLQNYVPDHPGFFVFKINVYNNGVEGDTPDASYVQTLTFNGAAGQKSFTIDDIPEGALVVVTEEYDGATYRLTSSPEQRGTITLDEILTVEFTNEGSTGEGGAIRNIFTHEDDGWHCEQAIVVE